MDDHAPALQKPKKTYHLAVFACARRNRRNGERAFVAPRGSGGDAVVGGGGCHDAGLGDAVMSRWVSPMENSLMTWTSDRSWVLVWFALLLVVLLLWTYVPA